MSQSGNPDTIKPSNLLGRIKARSAERAPETMSLEDWMKLCQKGDRGAYANYADRLLAAIGEPDIVDTRLSDQQTRLVHASKKIARYAPFADLYDAEDTISQIVTYIQNGAKGILVLRGPVGSGKTEIATIFEKLVEKQPVYLLKCKTTGKISPFNDTPLCLFSGEDMAKDASVELGIPLRYLNQRASAWVTKRLANMKEGQDWTDIFEVVKLFPSRDRQVGVAKLDPKDPKTADMASLVGKTDMTMVGEEDPLDADKTLKAGDPDAYIPGAFSQSNGGVLHAAEFFRNNPALLNAFLEGVTTGYFTGEDGIGVLPMNQLIVITSNDPVWRTFKASNDSDAARNRIEVIDVPYTLRMSEEIKIYEKLLGKSPNAEKLRAPGTLELLAEFAVVSRLMNGVNDGLKAYDGHVRAKVLNGEIPDGADKKVPKLHELRAKASPEEGLSGFTIRDAERVLLRAFAARANEGIVEADTILLLETLRSFIKDADVENISEDDKKRYLGIVGELAARNRKELEKQVNAAIIDADDATCQRIFDEYLQYAEAWIDDKDMFTPTGEPISFSKIEKFLEAFEKKANVTDGKEFRKSAVAAINSELARIAKSNATKTPDQQVPVVVRWDTYEPVAKAIRAQYEVDQDSRRQILRAKSAADLRSDEERRQHSRFHDNMRKAGYTDTMVARIIHHLSYND